MRAKTKLALQAILLAMFAVGVFASMVKLSLDGLNHEYAVQYCTGVEARSDDSFVKDDCIEEAKQPY